MTCIGYVLKNTKNGRFLVGFEDNLSRMGSVNDATLFLHREEADYARRQMNSHGEGWIVCQTMIGGAIYDCKER